MKPPPRDLPAFPNARRVKPKTPVRGGGGLRRRWRDINDDILEWDSLHGTIERYDSLGRHLGEYDPNTGAQLSPQNPKYRVAP